MTSTAQALDRLTPDQYLQREEISPVKHEYIDGEIYPMVGASDPHVTIAGNLFALLRSHLRGSGCRVFISDMKVRINTPSRFYYPDILVTCDDRDRETPLYKQHPRLIVEVLSPSTEAFDRGDKFADYRQLPSLEEYVLISAHQPRIECFRRSSNGIWTLHPYEGQISGYRLESLSFEGSFDQLYEDVIFLEQAS